jgi:hypothetical protein
VTEGGRHSLALGHGLRWEALVMGDALANKTAYLPGNSWILFDYPGCEGRGLWCHLHPVADCRPWPKTRQSELRVTHVHRVWPIPREWEALGHFGWSSALLGAVVSPRPYMVRCPVLASSKIWCRELYIRHRCLAHWKTKGNSAMSTVHLTPSAESSRPRPSSRHLSYAQSRQNWDSSIRSSASTFATATGNP